jgi:hypothetical protein
MFSLLKISFRAVPGMKLLPSMSSKIIFSVIASSRHSFFDSSVMLVFLRSLSRYVLRRIERQEDKRLCVRFCDLELANVDRLLSESRETPREELPRLDPKEIVHPVLLVGG